MKISQFFLSIAVFILVVFSLVGTSQGAEREFTDTKGRKILGELMSTKEGMITIKRNDGQIFTVLASNFIEEDIKYFKRHGLVESDAPKPVEVVVPKPVETGGNLAAKALPRLDLKVISKKKDRQTTSYSNEQILSYLVKVKNLETNRNVEKLHGVLMVFAKSVRHNDETHVMTFDEVDFDVKALDTFEFEMKNPVRLNYDTDSSYGLRSSGYLSVIKDSSGKVLNVSASSETMAKNQEAILKLKMNDVFGKDYKVIRSSSTRDN